MEIDDSVPGWLRGDERRIIQIVSNLINNAVKFTEKGSITVTTTSHENNLMIRVRDTGIGIPKDMHEVIFEAFKRIDPSVTREYSGTGLGLAITKRLVEEMKGQISVESAPQKGSCFTVSLPMKVVEKKETSVSSQKPSEREYNAETISLLIKKGISCHVLVAEDNESNRLYVKELLSKAGVYCDFVKNGKQAIELLEQKMNTDDQYDLLLLDIQMPLMSGVDVITYLRNRDGLKHIHCIALTAHALKGDEKKYLNAGCNAYCAKPLKQQVLYKHITHMLEQKENSYEYEPSTKNISLADTPAHKERLLIGKEKKNEIKKLIMKLKDNYALYNRQELQVIREEMGQLLPGPVFQYVDVKLYNSIKTYDDEMLLEVISFLEPLVEEKPLEVQI
jgi:CheY-like chemotaxis protein/anti-sigma regulatory factor (Ser/Thr protein kinase)